MVTRLRNLVLYVSCALLLLSGCQPISPVDGLSGRITFWHSWTGEDAAELRSVLRRFQEIHPGVRIAEISLPEDQILAEYRAAARNGLAPGVLLGRNRWIPELAGDGLIRPFPAAEAALVTSNIRNRAIVEYNDQLFGLPLFLAPRALYYNKSLVSEPSTTLDELLQQAAAGKRVEFVPRFEEAYWGIQAFGEGLFDADRRFTLAESGFEEWLAWLDRAQRAQGVILNVDDESLLDLFASGLMAYYVSGPESIKAISASMDPDNPFEIGVVPLPGGPNGPSGPIAEAETLMFFAHASPQEARIANVLATFLYNERQGIQFMRELDKVPANPRIVADRRVYPLVSGFVQQARTAVALPNGIPRDQLSAAGNRAYTSVLSGAASPAEAVCQFGEDVVGFLDYTADQVELPETCETADN
ncbi:MAG: extracellular solute-binding protein [Caldilineaceae bacterium]